MRYSKKNLSQCHFYHQKSYKGWPGNKPGPPVDSDVTASAMAEPFLLSAIS
jgi:hypothetical protein